MHFRNKQYLFRKGNTNWLNDHQKKELDHSSSLVTGVSIPSEPVFHLISLYFLCLGYQPPLCSPTVPPNFATVGKKSLDHFILPYQPFFRKEFHCTSFLTIWLVGLFFLLEDTREHDCFQYLLVQRKTKYHSKLARIRSINPVSCFTIYKSVLSNRLVLHLFSGIRKHIYPTNSTVKNYFS